MSGMVLADKFQTSEDTHGSFDGTVLLAKRSGDYGFDALLTARDQDYPAGTTFSGALFRLDQNGIWQRAVGFGYDNHRRQCPPRCRSVGLSKRNSIENEPVWIGARINPPSGTFPTGVVPKLYDSGFLNGLSIREL